MASAHIQTRKLFFFSSAVLMTLLVGNLGVAQDAVYRIREGKSPQKMSGKITATSAESVTIGGKEVPTYLISKVEFSNESPSIDRARKQMLSGSYSDAIEELKKVKGNVNKNMKSEIDYINAYSVAEVSLRGGSVTPKNAAVVVKKFITANPKSRNLRPAVYQFARLAFAAGLAEVSEKEFKKLQNTGWTEYKLKGHFYAGEMQIVLGKFDEAKVSYKAIQALGATDDQTQQYKLLASCQLAKIQGLQGDDAAAKKAIEKIIKDENPDNKKLFAYLYNALGAVHEKSGRLKEAARAYLHTELLFATEQEAHAEALFRLAKIWPQLEETDRANRARDTIKSRYRNSYWVSGL